MSLTVVIPTYNRPDFLGPALESVKRQTIAHHIKKIIVSENSDNDESRSICDAYKDLNIEYIKQPETMSSVAHLSWLFEQADTEYTAMLHDDDWWYPTHLENGISGLNNNSNAVCYFSNFFFAENELLKNVAFHHPNVLSYAGIASNDLDSMPISFKTICVICFLYTPFHFSSIIGRSGNLKVTVNDSMKSAKPYYADRILYPSLAAQGELIFNAQPLVGIRKHSNNGESSITISEKAASHLEGSEKIMKLASEKGIDIINSWQLIKNSCKPHEWREICDIFLGYFGNDNIDKYPIFKQDNIKYGLPKRIFTKIYSLLKSTN